ncbi:MAG: NAD(P)(+) transhydrogenase (Re/Si-specific) subunit beta [candidate division WOR-3 bacterium]|nr:NAD(P)(+) transhydrogenase (Re/Si-specific) subunit beta [candidate division WOR-3 bacterium]MCX7947082.1 NAD(P)(+) transhydrogenase (Re/Si-specific) subunit beta [candidate division WOR-3 bacterium]MDW8149877.1 NAD(P)(+) transhydrogenase (Re/Si-specific) subunit beta [candidate division WOR-3 bacterium]
MSIVLVFYLITVLLFIFGLKLLQKPQTARLGNIVSAIGMTIAVIATFFTPYENYLFIFSALIIGSIIGIFLAYWVDMRAIPQFVAILNSFGGAVSALVGIWAFLENRIPEIVNVYQFYISVGFDTFIGTITFVGSIIAFLKLQGIITEKPILIPFKNFINLILLLVSLVSIFAFAIYKYPMLLWIVLISSIILGLTLTLPIGGADMPVLISLLISYAGLSATALGFTFSNYGLIMVGSLVGASGLILTRIMAKAMNRDFWGILLGNITPPEVSKASDDRGYYEGKIKTAAPEEIAMLLDYAKTIAFVPGYGLAVSQAQQIVKELYELLTKDNKEVYFAIHPVAGRMPGHMNVLLAEVDIPYDKLKTLEESNELLPQTDISIVVGANDVVNPLAREKQDSPIYGMPILDVDKSKTVVVIKRSLAPGFSGIVNPLFIGENTIMVFGDAKPVLTEIVRAYKELKV